MFRICVASQWTSTLEHATFRCHLVIAIKLVRVHITLEKLENAALFLRLGLQPTTTLTHIYCENAFQTKGIWKRQCGRKTFCKRSFAKSLASKFDLPQRVLLKQLFKLTSDWWLFLNSSGIVWMNNMIRSQGATSFFKYISTTRDKVWPHFETPGRELKTRRVAEYSWPTLKCLEMQSDTVLSVEYISTMKLRRTRKIKIVKRSDIHGQIPSRFMFKRDEKFFSSDVIFCLPVFR